MTKVYFPNCNGLRFVASIFVIIYHIEQVKYIFKFPNHFHNLFLSTAGVLSIISFYVLSGFLITYLLVQEKKDTQTISLRKFYMRRILRIWPLYFFIIALSLFVLPKIDFFSMPELSAKLEDHFGLKVLLYILMLPNLVVTLFGIVPYASQSWSIGVEEQCYVIWPLMIKKFNKVHRVLFAVIIIYLGIKFGLILFQQFVFNNYYIKLFAHFWGTFSIDCMAIGGLAALILFYKKKLLLSFIFNKYTQVILYSTIAVSLLTGYTFYRPLFFEFYSVLFAIMILNLAANKKSIVNMENKVFNYLGKISYGLYMYHAIAIVIVLKLVTSNVTNYNVPLYIGSFLLTITLAIISYEIFEKRFILTKKKYSKVISGDNVKEEIKEKTNQDVLLSQEVPNAIAPVTSGEK